MRIRARRAALVAAVLTLSAYAVPTLGRAALAAAPAPGHLSGVVRDEAGAGLTGVSVQLSTPSGPVAATATTDPAGNYAMDLPAGLYDLTVVTADAAGPWTAEANNISVWSDTPLDVSVVRPDTVPSAPAGGTDPAPPGTDAAGADPAADPGDPGAGVPGALTWQGRVRAAAGATAVPGAQLSLTAADGPAAGSLTGPGADGAFSFSGPPGHYGLALSSALSAVAGGVPTGAADTLALTGTVDLTADRAGDLTLPAAGAADVVVADANGHKDSGPLPYRASALDPVALAADVPATALVSATATADDGGHFSPVVVGLSEVTFTVPDGAGTVPVVAPLGPGGRLAVVLGDRTTPPGAPQGVTATAGDGKVTVSWNPPVSDGGSPITNYLVTATHGGSNYKATFKASALSGVVRNLVNGEDYTITVVAKNAKGTGATSPPLTIVLDGSGTTVPAPGSDPVGGSGAGAGDGAPTGSDAPAGRSGYWLLGADGAVYPFGDAAPYGDASAVLASGAPAARAVDLEPTPSGQGYWVLDSRGRVHPFGDAGHYGDVVPSRLSAGEVPASLSATPTGAGYWVFTSRGRAFPFGDAAFLGDMSGHALNGPVLDSVATPSGHGYYMVASDGGIFAFGDAAFAGSMGGQKLNAPVRSLVPDGDGAGYWLVASDGGVFAFDAPFRGSMGGQRLNQPVQGMVRYGDGYLMVASDGGIFAFSDRSFTGSLGSKPPTAGIVSVAALG
ncbi:MAG TPA: carboxypeptidase regulatory-like domain-containing protein [Acidimicrobiia bacterium]|nr:carboxypeptidase regulatory-like domain-containing protein [Acidimicrobiia bacterium]